MRARAVVLGWLAVFFTVASVRAEDQLEPGRRPVAPSVTERETLRARVAVQDARAQLGEVVHTTDYVRSGLEHALGDGSSRVQSYAATREGREQEARRQARLLYKLARGGLLRFVFDPGRNGAVSRLQRGRMLRWLIDHDVHELEVHRRAESRARAELMLAARELESLDVLRWGQGLQATMLAALDRRLEARTKDLDEGAGHETVRLRRALERGSRHWLLARGRLAWPAQGRIVRGFGRDTTKTGVGLVHRGVEISVGRRTLVRAAASGRVAYVGELPGHGTGVVIDHGAGFRSITGPLGSIDVREGDAVDGATVLGRTPQRSFNGKVLYFELRHGERPVDPTPFFTAVVTQSPDFGPGRAVPG